MNTQPLYTNVLMSQVFTYQDTVYLAGRFADAAPYSNDINLQVGNTLAAIQNVLHEAGSDKAKLLSVTIYLKNAEADFEAIDLMWTQWLPEGVTPARTTMKAELVKPEALVEIAVIAAL